MSHDTSDAIQEGLRQKLTEAVMFRIEDELENVIATLSPDESDEIRMAIREEVAPHAKFVLNRMSLSELTNESAIQEQIDDSIATAEYLVSRVADERSRFKTRTPWMAELAVAENEEACTDCDGTGAFDLFDGVECEHCGGTGRIPKRPGQGARPSE